MLRTFTLLLAASTFMVLPALAQRDHTGTGHAPSGGGSMDRRVKDFIRRLLARFMRRPDSRVVRDVCRLE